MIKVKELKKTYGKGTSSAEEVLHGVSFELPEKGFVCILGRSGSGKTSLLNAIGGLDEFDSGLVSIEGAELTHSMSREMEKQRNANFGYVFQNYYLLPEHSAAYNVYLGLHSLELTEKEKYERVKDALKKVDMLRFRKRLVGELSGGQQQRVAIARAIAKAPKVIFADEPTGNLDEASTLNICSLLKELSRRSLVVMVTHEERLANFFADRIITIEDGQISSDDAEWERGTLVSADKNTVYAGDHKEERFSSEGLNIRVLSAEGAAPASITLVVEEGRLIIKTDDKRLMTCSRLKDPPFIAEGNRPKLTAPVREAVAEEEEETEQEPLPQKKASRSGLGLKMLFSELRTTASKKKLRNAATALFTALLAVMLLFSAADILTAAKIDPEDFITADSHVLDLKFDKGPRYNNREALSVADYIPGFLDRLGKTGADVDLIPDTSYRFEFTSDELPQLGMLSMSLGKYYMVDIERLDPSTIVYGRMPERYDEIVVDRWIIKKCTSTDGIVQNLIPDNEYMIGKRVYMKRGNYYPTIVGICDSGEPSIYISKTGMLSVAVHGIEAMSYSEFVGITGRELEPLSSGEAYVIRDNVGAYYLNKVGTTMEHTNGMSIYLKDVVKDVEWEYYVFSPLIIPDEDVELYVKNAVGTVTHFSVWCSDKEAAKKALRDAAGGELEGVINLEIGDTYQTEYNAFMRGRTKRLQTRTAIMGAIGLLCLVMLYVIQRFRVRDRMSMISVYRLLGIPKRDSAAVFVLENILLTLKYAVPAILITWAVLTVLPLLGVGGLTIDVPLWLPFAVLGAMIAANTIVALLAVLPLLRLPPAKLAAKYDF